MWNSLFKADAWLVPISARCIKDSAGLLRNIPLEKFSPKYFNTFSQDHICKVGKNIFRNSCWRGFPIIFTISWCFLIGRLTQYIIYCMSRWNYSVSYFVRSFIFNGEKCVGISARRFQLLIICDAWLILMINNRIPHPPDVWRAKPVWDSAYEPDALLSTIRPLWALPPLQVIILHCCRDGRGSLFHGAGREKGSPHSPQCGAGRPSLHGCLIRSLFWHNENLGIFALVIKKPFYRSDIWSQFSKEVI